MRAPLPTGAVTFAFTDIEGSTARWERNRVAMQEAVRRHDAILRAAIAEHGGSVFKTIGDAFCCAFARPEDAVAAMLAAQQTLAAEDFSAIDGLRVRAAIHSGTADEREGDYFGPAVNKVARLLAIGHGGQILLTAESATLVDRALPADVVVARSGRVSSQGLYRAAARASATGSGIAGGLSAVAFAGDATQRSLHRRYGAVSPRRQLQRTR